MLLRMIYLQRLIQPVASVDFLTPWIHYGFQRYTGQASYLPILLFPNVYKTLCKKCPPLRDLLELMHQLPPLQIRVDWHSSFLLDLPLDQVIVSKQDSTLPRPAIPLRYLLSDICCWNPTQNRLEAHRALLKPNRSILLKTFDALFYPQEENVFACTLISTVHPNIQFVPPQSLLPPIRIPEFPADSSYVTSWRLPALSRRYHPVNVTSVRPKRLRLYWIKQQNMTTPLPQWDPPPEHPGSVPWRTFWSLDLPLQAITPWWRLLRNSIGYAARLHRWNPTKYESPQCILCKDTVESLYHFVYDCTYKYAFWARLLNETALSQVLSQSRYIWSALLTLKDAEGERLEDSSLVILGTGLAALWRYHWLCFFEDQPWVDQECFNIYLKISSHISG